MTNPMDETQQPEQLPLEKELCCICNGKGVQPGENAFCAEHYKSEVVDKKEKQEPFVGIRLNFDESGMFLMTFVEGTKALFQIKMNPENFEKLSNDMIRIVKNYNLYQIQKYNESKNGKEEVPSVEGGSLPDSPCANPGCETQCQQPQGDS